MTFRVGYVSDLHAEFYRGEFLSRYPGFKEKFADCDLVLLPGDNHIGDEHLLYFIEAVFPTQQVIFNFGNHEYYHQRYRTANNNMAIMTREKFKNGRVKFLNPGRVVVNDGAVEVISATLWTDFAYYGDDTIEASMFEAQRAMNDYRLIFDDHDQPITPEFTAALHQMEREFILGHLSRPFKGSRIVMTHHAPITGANPPRFNGSQLVPAFLSDLTEVIKTYDIDYWICGHTHHCFEKKIEGTIVCSAQGGYPRERMSWQTRGDGLPGNIIELD